MKLEVWTIGKTSDKWIETGVDIFVKRLVHYVPFAWTDWPAAKIKTTDGRLMKTEEGKMVLDKLSTDDFLVLLDEKGQEFTSVDFAQWLEKRLSAPGRRTVFLIGGAFGFSDEVYQRANAKVSLSRMTFSHQMVRVFLAEQLYRGMTILKNEKYHNI
jgi:23S rRNA (pseudouridine1915-N3)-methyltransferase